MTIEARELHAAVLALEAAPNATQRETSQLMADVVDAATALDHVVPAHGRDLQPVEQRILHDLNDEAFTITTVADFVASAIPEGQSHTDAVEIFEAGTRVAAVAVRLHNHLTNQVAGDGPAIRPPDGAP